MDTPSLSLVKNNELVFPNIGNNNGGGAINSNIQKEFCPSNLCNRIGASSNLKGYREACAPIFGILMSAITV